MTKGMFDQVGSIKVLDMKRHSATISKLLMDPAPHFWPMMLVDKNFILIIVSVVAFEITVANIITSSSFSIDIVITSSFTVAADIANFVVRDYTYILMGALVIALAAYITHY